MEKTLAPTALAVPESKIVETLIDEAMRIAEQMDGEGSPSVSVSG